MELMAVIAALESLNQSSQVALHTDSSYVKQGITSWIHQWKKRGWKTAAKSPVKNRDLWERLSALADQHDIRWSWVKGHSGDKENERCDYLATQAIDSTDRAIDTGYENRG